MTNIKHASRQPLRNPIYALVASLILALKIGGTTAI
ncbi:MAG: hypothetical protein M2R45_03235 [Verrucomicrobia subdivision 3 bacterium]|nr:hypothetical protein [Limisphaerales bacterium]MCS1416096.1 hypothetical protein [Limisphaerales bacterium]